MRRMGLRMMERRAIREGEWICECKKCWGLRGGVGRNMEYLKELSEYWFQIIIGRFLCFPEKHFECYLKLAS